MKSLFLTSACALIAATGADAQDLTITGFGGSLQDAQRAAYFAPFEQATGIKVSEDTYGGGISKIKAMVDTGSVVWDVVQMDENEMVLACDEGLLETFSAADLGIDGSLLDQAKASDCGVGFFVWSMVLGYDGARQEKAPASWSDMWDLETWPGGRGLRKQARMTLEIALLADGVAPSELYDVLATPEGADRAFAKLDEIKDSIVWWESGAQAPEWLASGDVALTAAYNGRIANANKEGRDFGIAWTNQLYAMDFWTVVKGGDLEKAKEFITFAMDAPNQKAFTDQIPYGVTNVEANVLIEPEIAPQLPTSPANLDGALSLSTAFWVDHEEELQTRFTQWLAN